MAKCELCGVDVTFDIVQHYVPDFDGKKHRVCKECSTSTGDKALKYDPAVGKLVIVERSEIEIRKKCNVCGHVFCYNPVDLDNNKKKQQQAIWSAVGSLGGAMSGHYAASAMHQNNTNQAMGGIVDYNKCPNCGSMDLRIISKEELAAAANSNTQQPAAPQFSTADELKKLKELLDLGVISQEEFDEKKNEYLHGVPAAAKTPAPIVPQPQTAPVVSQPQPAEPSAAAQSTETPVEPQTKKVSISYPKLAFWVVVIWRIIKGYREVYYSTNLFRDIYYGKLSFIVGHIEVLSAILAGLIWIVLAIFLGFIAAKIASFIQRKVTLK